MHRSNKYVWRSFEVPISEVTLGNVEQQHWGSLTIHQNYSDGMSLSCCSRLQQKRRWKVPLLKVQKVWNESEIQRRSSIECCGRCNEGGKPIRFGCGCF